MNVPRRRTRVGLFGAGIAGAALIVAGCGSSGSTGAGSAPSGGAASPASGTTVSVAHTAIGDVLVDAQGRTLYGLQGGSTANPMCSGECLDEWPLLRATGTPTAGSGVTGTLTTFRRDDGTNQVALDGHPLYRFSGDSGAAQTHGEGVKDEDGTWFAMSPSGSFVQPGGTTPGPSSSSNGGYNY